MVTTIDPVILSIIMLASRAFDVQAPLIAAIIDQESGFNFHALGDYNKEGNPESFGLMQLHIRGAGYGYSQDQLLNPAFNIMVGTEYLRACKDAFPNNTKLAISAYNQGQGGAARRGWGHNEGYVNNVFALWEKYKKEMSKVGD
jgi:soluble lytic murein transglycosylase-like protein